MPQPPQLLNPLGTATRQDLVDLITIVQIVLTGHPEACFVMIEDLIKQLNKQV